MSPNGNDMLDIDENYLPQDINIFGVLSVGTPRNDKTHRRSKRTKLWRLMDLCTWIGRKVNTKYISVYYLLLF